MKDFFPFCSTPTDIRVKLDRSVTLRHHLLALRKKTIFARHTAEVTGRFRMECLCQNTTHSCLIMYCAPVWCRSAHTCLIDSVFNDSLRIVTGYLRPTPTDHLPILSGIQPAELWRLGATLSLLHRGSLDPDHILYFFFSGSSNARQERQRSRRPFVPPARNLLDNLAGIGIRASE